MKKFFLLITGFIFSLTIIAQGNSGDKGKGNGKSKNERSMNRDNKVQHEKEAKETKVEHNKKVWDGTADKRGKGPKLSKIRPAKVREAFQRDYPNANNVTWTKYRGDWAASFRNGLVMSTAVYHANGERRDTRTPVTRKEMPRNVLDSIIKRRPGTRLDDIIKIEVPSVIKDIFRTKDNTTGKPEYFYYNSYGQLINYDY